MILENQVRKMAGILGEERIISTLKKLAEIEAGHCLLKISNVNSELFPFEKRFNMSSERAWEEFNKGALGDDMDIMEWMGLYENLLDFKDEYQRILNCELPC